MRVAEITKTPNYSGIATMVWGFCSGIKNKEIKIDIISPKNAFFEKCKKENNNDRPSFIRVEYKGNLRILRSIRYYWAIKKTLARKKYDIVHIHSDNDIYTIITVLASRKSGAKIILHAHNDATRNKIINILAKSIVKKNKCILLSCSEKAAEAMFPKNEKWMWIKNGIKVSDYAFSEKNRNLFRNKYGIKRNEILVGAIGRLSRQKNYSYLISIFDAIPNESNVKLMIIGAGELRETIEQQIKESGLENRIILIERSFEVGALLSAFDYFVLPSLHEGLPVVAVESQACGLPTIISDKVSKMTQITDLCERLSIDEKSKGEWAKRLTVMPNNQRSKYAKIVSDAGFSIEASAMQVERVYERLYSE